ncbi:MAG: metallopeptidase TldD-related protein [Kiloniellales bacterium]|nr:metallopeptidase TldD-related protein [Kiloniellales bacterium]
MPADQNDLDLLTDLLARAKAAGADAADAVMVHATSLSHARRLGELERLERAESSDLGLRVLVGRQQAVVSSTDVTPPALAQLVEQAVAMARSVPEDPYCGLADPEDIAREVPELETCDPEEPATEILIERAKACEDAARAVPGVTNSEGAEAGWSMSRVTLAASNGFAGGYAGSSHSIGVAVLAGEGQGMERDYDYSSVVYGADLEDPAEVGRRAGERTVRRLGPRKPDTGKYPVVFDPRVGNGLLRHLSGAINGTAIARGTSFLKDAMETPVFAAGITIVDDPHRPRGLRSKPFDGEGLANRRREIVEAGVLKTWILDLRSARQLGLTSTGHAARGTSAPPSPAATNLYMKAGPESPEALIGEIDQGLYVTEMMGMGINMVTGDYSRGAAGNWIEKGELTHPVSELTVAGNLKDMFAKLTPASDLVFRYGVNAPTLRIDGMTLAGA